MSLPSTGKIDPKLVAAEPLLPPNRLIELYRIAIEEYRFEVKLGWDRAMQYIVFNTGVLSIGTGLLKLESSSRQASIVVENIMIGLIFGLGVCTSLIGIRAVKKSHEYYRRTVVKKTLIEDMLGFTAPIAEYPARHSLAIGTTTGQSEHLGILYNPDKYVNRKISRGAITYWHTTLFWILAFVNLIGASFAIALAFGWFDP